MSYRSSPGCPAAGSPELREQRAAAADFYRVNRVPEELERALNLVLDQRPPDLHGYLAQHFSRRAAAARISRLKGRQLYDARGRLALEAQLFCVICNQEKRVSSAAVASDLLPQETSVDRMASSQERADHVMTAVRWIDGPLDNMLKDQNPCDQSGVDRILSNFFMARYLEEKERRSRKQLESSSLTEPVVLPSPLPTQGSVKKSADRGPKGVAAGKPLPPAEPPEPVQPGSLAIGSLSLAVVKAGAHVKDLPLYKYTATLRTGEAPAEFHVPTALVTLLSCGKSSPGKLSLLEEVIVIPKAGHQVQQIITMTLELQKEVMRIMNSSTKAGAGPAFVSESGAVALGFERPEQPLDVIAEACASLGLALGTQVHLAVNCAAPELMDYSKGKYEVSTGVLKSPDELLDLYQNLLSRYPAVVALIDPFRKEDKDQWQRLSDMMGGSCSLLSDIASKSQAPPPPGAAGYILRLANERTVSDLVRITSEQQGSVLIGSTYDEPCSDDSLSDIAVGLGLDFIKLGGLSGAERMMKYNRLISIEEELAQQGILVSRKKLLPPLFPERPQEQFVSAEDRVSD